MAQLSVGQGIMPKFDFFFFIPGAWLSDSLNAEVYLKLSLAVHF